MGGFYYSVKTVDQYSQCCSQIIYYELTLVYKILISVCSQIIFHIMGFENSRSQRELLLMRQKLINS